MTAPAGTVEAIEQIRLYFAPLATRQGILARRSLGQPTPEDDDLSRALLRRMSAEISADGSLNGGVVATIWRAHELLDLGCDTNDPAWHRLMSWIVDLQRRPGAFSQGCTPARHAYHACQHFISGFFSPAPPEQRITPIMLPNGKVFRAVPAARFAISCLALRAALRAGLGDQHQIEHHTTSLVQLQPLWVDWNGYFAPDVIVSGVHSLACASPAQRKMVPRLGQGIVEHQAEDGTWAKADLFHTLDALLAVGSSEARDAVRRAIPALLSRQRADGSFGSTAQQERALIALRALIWAEQEG
jgi:hypothetical protein